MVDFLSEKESPTKKASIKKKTGSCPGLLFLIIESFFSFGDNYG